MVLKVKKKGESLEVKTLAPSDTALAAEGLDTKTKEKQTHPTLSPSEEISNQNPVELVEPLPVDPPSDRQPRSKLRVAFIVLALYMSLFVAALDATIVSTAIPTITSDFHSPSGYSWIGGAFLIAEAAGSPVWAKLSDIWGRKPILLAELVLFMGSSVICGAAVDIRMLIAGRALQGVAGGGILMTVSVVISDIFSMRQRSLILGFCEAIWAIAGAVGPILGGVLTSLASWRWCFWINLPFCGLALLVLFFYLDVHNPRTSIKDGVKAIDWAGSLSILAFTVMLLIGLDFGGATFPWNSPNVICLIVFGALCSLLFIYSEKRLAKFPLMPLELFRSKSNVASLLVGTFHSIPFIAGEYYMPLYFQSAKAASPLRSGVLLVPLIVTTASCGVLCGVIIHRFGRYREVMWVGTTLLTVGTGSYINLTPNSTIGKVVGFQILAGLGSGLLFQPPLTALQAHTEQQDVATATSTFTFVRSLSLAISVVLGSVVFQNRMEAQAPKLRSAGIPEEVANLLTGKNAAANVMLTHTLKDEMQREVVKKAFADSMRAMWIMYCVFAGCGVVASMFIAAKDLDRVHVETVTGLLRPSNEGREMVAVGQNTAETEGRAGVVEDGNRTI